ncbi:MAG TPA: immunoglobulin domain-containing protein [Candidatus Binatia bacterium]|jgi:Leucine-rich repeat (LRR) protein|nr:immunoglobulin domain-containing protein [Candidatus Binatia bacterium]
MAIAFCLGLGFALRAPAAGCDPAPAGLVSWWPGDGNANDIVGTNNGTLAGNATAIATGNVLSAFSFDGTNSFVQIPNAASLRPTNLTIETWVNFSALDSAISGNAPQGDQYLVFKQSSKAFQFEGYSLEKLRVGNGDVFLFTVASSSGQEVFLPSVTTVSTGVWYHVAAVRGPNSLQIYVNGRFENQTNVSFPQDYGTQPVYFGTSGQPYWDGKLKGRLDEVSLYNRALSSNEIAGIYAAGVSGKCKGVIITTQPQSQTVIAGSNALFTVSATGFGQLSYQWQFNGTNLAGATATSLSLTNVQSANGGNYTVVASNSLNAAVSMIATLTVLSAPNITTQPQSLTNIVGTTASFSVLAGGALPLGYQWQLNGAAIGGATDPGLLLTNLQPTDAGNYTVAITNVAGAVTSAVATLTVWVPPAISTQPAGFSAGVGSNLTLSVAATGTLPLAYQWRLNGANISGAAGSSFTRTNAQCAHAGNYDLVVGNVAGNITSSVAAVTLVAPPGISIPPVNQSVGQGQNATLNVLATNQCGGGLTYQWRFGGGNISGATDGSYVRTNAQCVDAGNYDIVVTTLGGSITSSIAAVTVIAPPAISTPPSDQTVAQGQNVTLSALATNQCGGGLTYQWRLNSLNIPGATATNYTRTNLLCADAGNYDVVATTLGGSATSSVAVVTVVAPPGISVPPGIQTVAQGQDVTLTVLATNQCGGGLAYQWRFGGGNISGATGTSYTRTNAQCADAGGYDVVVTTLAGGITSSVAGVTVVAPPGVSIPPASQTVTQGQATTFTVLAANQCGGGLTYQWRFNGGNIPGATSTSYTNTSPQCADAGNYDVVIATLAGSLTSGVASLAVVSPPAVTTGPVSQTVTQGQTVTFAVLATNQCGGGLIYQWRFNGGNLSGATGTGYTNSSSQCGDAGNYDVVVANPAGSLTSSIASLIVVAPPSITIGPLSQTVTQGQNLTFSVLATNQCGGGLTYQWRFNGGNIFGATGRTYTRTNAQCPDAGNFDVVVGDLAGNVTSSAAVASVAAPPVISSPPLSQTVAQNQNATFSVLATNLCAAGQVYQWRFNGGNILGATGSTYTRPNVQCVDAGAFDVIVTNLAGSATSSVAALSVVAPPSITTPPLSQTVTQGQNVTFSLVATNQCGGGLTYQWRFNGGNLSGATGTSYTVTNSRCTDGGNYDVIVTNIAGMVASTPAVLTVGFSAVVLIPDPILNNALHCALSLGPCPVTVADIQKLTCLSANFGQVAAPITNLAGLGAATNLQNLYLNGNFLSDLRPLTNLTSLRTLEFEKNNVTNLAPLVGLTHLACLALGGGLYPPANYNPPTDYSVLSGLTNLTRLSVSYGNLSGFNSLTNLPRLVGLTSLILYQNALVDLSPLAGLTNLTSLDLRWNRLNGTNCLPLLALTNLTTLYLGGNPLSTLPPLQTLTRLSYLNLDGTGLTDLTPLLGLTNLTYLSLNRNPGITNFSVLSALTNLVNLELSGNSLGSVGFLANLNGLAYADLSYNTLTNLSPLTGLSSVSSLVLAGDALTNFVPPLGMTSLANLWLHNNSISAIPELPWLNHLNLDRNPISNIARLSTAPAFTNLTGLGLSWNQVADFSPLASLPNLTLLRLEGDHLTDPLFPALVPSLSRLMFLDLSYNKISSPSWLCQLPNLRELYLGRNEVQDLLPLACLQNLVDLNVSLNFLSNPAILTELQNLQCQRTGILPCGCGWGTNFAQGLQCGGMNVTFPPQNQPPAISTMLPGTPPKWFIPLNSTSSLALLVSEDPSPPPDYPLMAGAISPNPGLVSILSVSNPVFGTDPDRTLAVATANQAGQMNLALQVTDDVDSTTSSNIQVFVVANAYLTNLCPNVDPILTSVLGSAVGTSSAALSMVDLLSLTNLFVSNANLNDPCVWQWLTNLTSLSLNGYSISNLLFLTNLTQLNSLSLYNSGVMDLSPLMALPNLTSLALDGNSLTNVAQLRNLPNLRALILNNNTSTDLSPLSSLSNLLSLVLEGDTIADAGFVTNLTQLRKLDLGNNHLTSLQPVAGLSNLTSLLLQQNRLRDLHLLTNLPSLLLVDLSLNPLNLSSNQVVSVIQTLFSNRVQVVYLPLRQLTLVVPNTNWFILTNTTSTLGIRVTDNGPTNEPVALAYGSSNQSLLPNANLATAPLTNLPPDYYYVFTAALRPGQTGASVITLTATDSAGLTTNSYILVSAVAPQPFAAQFASNANLTWTTWGNVPWFGETNNTHNGIWAAQSGHITDDQDSWLQTTVTGPGTLTFWWSVSSETNYDLLQFYTNGVLETPALSGEISWRQQTLNLPAGTQTLAWRYVKDPDRSLGADAAWLSEVAFTTPAPTLQLTPSTNGQMQITIHGIVGHLYQVEFSTDLANWSNLVTLTLTNSTIIIYDSAAPTGARFYRVRDLSTSLLRLDPPVLTNSVALLVLHSPPRLRFALQSSTNLTKWSSLATLTNTTGTLSYPAPRPTNSSRQFYRAMLLLGTPAMHFGGFAFASPDARTPLNQRGSSPPALTALSQPSPDWTNSSGYAELAGDEAV